MAAPGLTSVTPSSGLALGGSVVQIVGTGFHDEASGGTVRVFFGGVESPRYGPVSDTLILAQVPPASALGAVDLLVQNVTPGPPEVVEGTTLAGAFTYGRPSLATPSDMSNHGAIALVTRQLVLDFRLFVLQNTKHDLHPEYVDAASVSLPESAQAEAAPGLLLIGPSVTEDRFRSVNGPFDIETVGGFDIHGQPVTLALRYQYLGLGRSPSEASNLFEAVARYFNVRPALRVPTDGSDVANGYLDFELSPVWEQRAEFNRTVARNGLFQFVGEFDVLGVHVVADKSFEGGEVTEDPSLVFYQQD